MTVGVVLRPGAQGACGQPNESPQKLEDAVDDNPDESEGKQHEPQDRVEQQRQQGQRPADDQQQEPEQ